MPISQLSQIHIAVRPLVPVISIGGERFKWEKVELGEGVSVFKILVIIVACTLTVAPYLYYGPRSLSPSGGTRYRDQYVEPQSRYHKKT